MNDKKKPLGKVLPEDEKKNKEEYPDSVKSPTHGLEDKGETLDKALEDEEKENKESNS